MLQDILKSFQEVTCTIQLYSDALHAPIFGCRLKIENDRLIITPQVLFDDLADELLLDDLEVSEFNGEDMITLVLKKHPELRSINILKENFPANPI